MGIIFKAIASPIFLPLRGGAWVCGKIHQAAEEKLNHPRSFRDEIAELERSYEAGEISEEVFEQQEEILLARYMANSHLRR